MKELFRQLSFRRKLLISFVTLSCISVLLVEIVAYHLYTNFVINMTEKSSVETIDLVHDDIDSLLDGVRSLCDTLTGDIKMQEYLRMDFDSTQDQYSNDLTGNMELASISIYRKDIFGVYVFGQSGGRYKSNYYSFKSEDQRETTWYRIIVGSREAIWFPSHEGSFVVRGSISDNFITVGQPVMDEASGIVNGIAVVDIKEDAITQKIKHSFSNGAICTTDQEGNILFRSNAGNDLRYPIDISPGLVFHIPGSTGTAAGRSMVVPDSGYLVVSRTLMNSNRRTAGIMDRGLLTQSNKDTTHIVMLVLLIIAFSSLHVAMFIFQSIYKPVQILYHMMEEMENGDLSARYNYHFSDEFGRLGKNFNQMPERIQKLISQTYEEQRKLKNSELKTPQARIQPHFLHNFLDSVMWLLGMDKNRDAGKMLNELSTLFKISLSKGNEVITTEEELRHISSYLFITNTIYSRKFECATECDSVFYSYRTLKLLLQPLVENVITHATPMPGQKVFIRACIYEEEDSLVLSVQDISRGMDQETLENLQQRLGTVVHPDRRDSGCGLYNVNEHIHILFGSSHGLTIISEPDFGTEVIVEIPKLKGDDILVPGNAS